MRFLFFNLIVAVALIYLFGGQRPEIQAAGEKASQAVGQIKAMATSALGQSRAAAPAKIEPEPKPQAAVKPKPEPQAERLAEPAPAPQPQVMPNMVPPAPRPQVEVRTLAEPEREAAVRASAPAAPEVEKRRAEVLASGSDTIAPAPETQTVEISEDGKLMSATERRRALYRLAEEMELFSAGAALPGITNQ